MKSNLMARQTDAAGDATARMQEAVHIIEDTMRVNRVTPSNGNARHRGLLAPGCS